MPMRPVHPVVLLLAALAPVHDAVAGIEAAWARPAGHRYDAADPYANYKRARFIACKEEVLLDGTLSRRERLQACHVSDNPVAFNPNGVLHNPVTHYAPPTGASLHMPLVPRTPGSALFPVNVVILVHGYGGPLFFYCDDRDDFDTDEPSDQCGLNHDQHGANPDGYEQNILDVRPLTSLHRKYHTTGSYETYGYSSFGMRMINLIPYLNGIVPPRSIAVPVGDGLTRSEQRTVEATTQHFAGNDRAGGLDRRRWVVLPITLDINPGQPLTAHNEHGLATTHNGKRLTRLVDNLWRAYKGWIDTIAFVGHSTGGPVIKSVLGERLGGQARYLRAHDWILHTDDVIGLAPGYGGTPTVFCDPANDDLKVTLGGGIVHEEDFVSWSDRSYWTPKRVTAHGERKRTSRWARHLNVLTVAGVWTRAPFGTDADLLVRTFSSTTCPRIHGWEDQVANGDPRSSQVYAKARIDHHGQLVAEEVWWKLGKWDGAMGTFSTTESVAYHNGREYVAQTDPAARPDVEWDARWVLPPGDLGGMFGDGYASTASRRIVERVPVNSRPATRGRKVTYVEVDQTNHGGMLRNENVLYLIKRRLANGTTQPHFRRMCTSVPVPFEGSASCNAAVYYKDFSTENPSNRSGPWTFRQTEERKLDGNLSAMGRKVRTLRLGIAPYVRGAPFGRAVRLERECLRFGLRVPGGQGRTRPGAPVGSCLAYDDRALRFPGGPSSYLAAQSLQQAFWGGAEFTWHIRVKLPGSGPAPRTLRAGLISHGSGFRGAGGYLKIYRGKLQFTVNARQAASGAYFPRGRWVSITATKDRFGNLFLYQDGVRVGACMGADCASPRCPPGPCSAREFDDSRHDTARTPRPDDSFLVGASHGAGGAPEDFLVGKVSLLYIRAGALGGTEVAARF